MYMYMYMCVWVLCIPVWVSSMVPSSARRWSARGSESFGKSRHHWDRCHWRTFGSAVIVGDIQKNHWIWKYLIQLTTLCNFFFVLLFLPLWKPSTPPHSRQIIVQIGPIPGQNIMCGFNSPPSQSQLHLQWIVLPLLPLNRSDQKMAPVPGCPPSLSTCVPMRADSLRETLAKRKNIRIDIL